MADQDVQLLLFVAFVQYVLPLLILVGVVVSGALVTVTIISIIGAIRTRLAPAEQGENVDVEEFFASEEV